MARIRFFAPIGAALLFAAAAQASPVAPLNAPAVTDGLVVPTAQTKEQKKKQKQQEKKERRKQEKEQQTAPAPAQTPQRFCCSGGKPGGGGGYNVCAPTEAKAREMATTSAQKLGVPADGMTCKGFDQ